MGSATFEAVVYKALNGDSSLSARGSVTSAVGSIGGCSRQGVAIVSNGDWSGRESVRTDGGGVEDILKKNGTDKKSGK